MGPFFDRPAVGNIGGIANVTFLPPVSLHEPHNTQGILAFDTGPGNMLIDEAARLATDGAWDYDHDGRCAAQGLVDEFLVIRLACGTFFSTTTAAHDRT